MLVGLGNLSSLAPNAGKPPKGHSFDKCADGYCVAYIRDRKVGLWCQEIARTKAELIVHESAKIGDTIQAVWPEEDTWTEFTYVWDDGKWWATSPDEGTQTLVDLGDLLMGKRTLRPAVKAFGMVIGQHAAHDPANPDKHSWHSRI